MFSIIEKKYFLKQIEKKKIDQKLYQKIVKEIYPILEKSPVNGNNNIKKLKGHLGDFYRYRIGNYRLVYEIDKGKVIIFILYLKHRKEAY